MISARRLMAWTLPAAIAVAAVGVRSGTLLLAQAPGGAGSGVASGPVPGPLERQSNPITPENPVPRRLSAVTPTYPADAPGQRGTTMVALLVTIDESGRVVEARAVQPSARGTPGGAERAPFERSAIDAVRQWRFEPPAAPPITFSVRFSFSPSSETLMLGFGPMLPTLAGGPQNSAWQSATTRTPPRKVKDKKPRMPDAGLPKGATALVVIEVSLGADGRVAGARLLHGSPPFDAAALDAVKGWEFTPALADGKPVPFTMQVTVNFQNN